MLQVPLERRDETARLGGRKGRAVGIGSSPLCSQADPRPVSHLQSRYQNKFAVIGAED